MFDFFRKPSLRSLSPALRQALVASNLPAGCDAAKLGVVESRGRYAGRSVTYIRVFDPASAARRAVNVFSRDAYQDLTAHLDLVLRAGFVEKDGTVVLNAQPPDAAGAAGSREAADRSAHADDAQVVFPHAGS